MIDKNTLDKYRCVNDSLYRKFEKPAKNIDGQIYYKTAEIVNINGKMYRENTILKLIK